MQNRYKCTYINYPQFQEVVTQNKSWKYQCQSVWEERTMGDRTPSRNPRSPPAHGKSYRVNAHKCTAVTLKPSTYFFLFWLGEIPGNDRFCQQFIHILCFYHKFTISLIKTVFLQCGLPKPRYHEYSPNIPETYHMHSASAFLWNTALYTERIIKNSSHFSKQYS